MEYHRAPWLTVEAVFPGGSAADPSGKPGVAALTAAMLRRGTTTRTAAQVAEEIDFLGGDLSASAGPDRVSVTLTLLSPDAVQGLGLLADVLKHPAFPADELERERDLELSSLESIGEDPATVVQRVAQETVYAGHPYGALPTVHSLKSIGREDLAAYYHTFLPLGRMIVVAVGDFHHAEMAKRLAGLFGDPPSGNLDPLPAVPPAPTAAAHSHTTLIDKPDETQTQMRWIRPAMRRDSPGWYAAEVASAILGGGFTSRLVDEVRINRSLTYDISSRFAGALHGGDFEVSTFTKAQTTRALIDVTNSVLRRAAHSGFTEAELHKVQGYLSGMFAIELQTPEALASRLADTALFGLPDDYLQRYIARIHAVTLADVNRVARSYFAPEHLSLILLGPAARIEPQLAGLGAIDRRSLESVGK